MAVGVDEYGSTIGHADGHFVVEVERRHDDDFIVGVSDGQ